MASVYEEVEIEDMTWDEDEQRYTYKCPCGDIFRITLEELHDGEDIARCPSCTLIIRVIYDEDDLPELDEESEDEDEDGEGEGEGDGAKEEEEEEVAKREVDASFLRPTPAVPAH